MVGFPQRTAIVSEEWVLAKVRYKVYREERGNIEMKESGLWVGQSSGGLR